MIQPTNYKLTKMIENIEHLVIGTHLDGFL